MKKTLVVIALAAFAIGCSKDDPKPAPVAVKKAGETHVIVPPAPPATPVSPYSPDDIYGPDEANPTYADNLSDPYDSENPYDASNPYGEGNPEGAVPPAPPLEGKPYQSHFALYGNWETAKPTFVAATPNNAEHSWTEVLYFDADTKKLSLKRDCTFVNAQGKKSTLTASVEVPFSASNGKFRIKGSAKETIERLGNHGSLDMMSCTAYSNPSTYTFEVKKFGLDTILTIGSRLRHSNREYRALKDPKNPYAGVDDLFRQ